MPALAKSPESITTSGHRTYSRQLSLAILCAGTLMTILDGSIVSVAMPAIQRDLGFSGAGLAWVVNAYLIPFGGLLLLAGRMGDLLGRKRLFTSGLALFTLASAACGVAGSQGLLLAARAVQGVGGAMTMAVVLGMIVGLFPEPREQARAIAVFSATGSVGAALGIVLGGVLTQAVGWHWIFLINLPIGTVAWAAAVRRLAPDHGTGLGRGADRTGAALVTAALMLAVWTIVGAGSRGTGGTVALAALSLALLAAFAVRQRFAADPLVPLRLFRLRTVSGANAVQILMIATTYGFQYVTALHLQNVLGLDALTTGLAFLPVPVVIGAVMTGLSARAVGRFGAYRVLLSGLVLLAAGLALLSRVTAGGSYVTDVLPGALVMGVGFAVAMPPLTGLAMAGVREEDTGLASGLFNTTQIVGGSLGLALLTALAAHHTQGLVAHGGERLAATADGFGLAYGVGLVIGLAALVVAAVTLRAGRKSG